MNFKLIGLMAAAALATASCSQDKKVETTTTTTPETTTTTTTTTVDTMAAYDDARRMAARVAEDLKLTDTVVVRRIERTYYTRGRKINALQTQYATDTTGRYAAMRQANDDADNAIRTDLNSPAYYNTYSANRANYGDGPYSLAPGTVTTTTATTTTHRTGSSVGQGSGVKKMENQNDGDHKVKYENGAKIKRGDDGSVKIKMADGTKVKIDENGHRTVKKGLFK